MGTAPQVQILAKKNSSLIYVKANLSSASLQLLYFKRHCNRIKSKFTLRATRPACGHPLASKTSWYFTEVKKIPTYLNKSWDKNTLQDKTELLMLENHPLI